MNMDVGYRARQFWAAVRATPDPADLQLAQSYLTAKQIKLFESMQPSEQAHSLQVFKQLYIQAGQNTDQMEKHYPDLLVAALLHDVGKSRQPLRLWERVLIVLARAFFPRQARQWGHPREAVEAGTKQKLLWLDWRRPFIIAEQHPRWGAEMAADVGASPLTISLILHHQQEITAPPTTMEERFLHKLQSVDSTL